MTPHRRHARKAVTYGCPGRSIITRSKVPPPQRHARVSSDMLQAVLVLYGRTVSSMARGTGKLLDCSGLRDPSATEPVEAAEQWLQRGAGPSLRRARAITSTLRDARARSTRERSLALRRTAA